MSDLLRIKRVKRDGESARAEIRRRCWNAIERGDRHGAAALATEFRIDVALTSAGEDRIRAALPATAKARLAVDFAQANRTRVIQLEAAAELEEFAGVATTPHLAFSR